LALSGGIVRGLALNSGFLVLSGGNYEANGVEPSVEHQGAYFICFV